MGPQRDEHHRGSQQRSSPLDTTHGALPPRQPGDPALPQPSPACTCVQGEERAESERLDDESGVDDGEHPLVQERTSGSAAGGCRVPAEQASAELEGVADDDRGEQPGGGPEGNHEDPGGHPSAPRLGEQEHEHDHERVEQGALDASGDHRGAVLEQTAAVWNADATARCPGDLEREVGHAGGHGQHTQDSLRAWGRVARRGAGGRDPHATTLAAAPPRGIPLRWEPPPS